MTASSETGGTPAPAGVNQPAALTSAQVAAMVAERRKGAASAASVPAQAEPAKPAAEAAEVTPQTDNLEAEASADQVDEAKAADSAEAEASDDPSTEGDADGGEQDDSDFEVELPDGEKVTLKELVAARMKDADYRQKTAALAREREALEARERAVAAKEGGTDEAYQGRMKALDDETAKMRAQRNQYEQVVNQFGGQLEAVEKQWAAVDWSALEERDPDQALKLRLKYLQFQEQKSIAQKEIADLRKEREAEAEKLFATRREALQKHVTMKYPELTNPETGNKLWGQMIAVAKELGYSEVEIRNTLNPRAFDMWLMATRYHTQQAEQKAVAASKPQTLPKASANGHIRVLKQGQSRARPPAPPKAALGRAQAAYNAKPTAENFTVLLKARRAAG